MRVPASAVPRGCVRATRGSRPYWSNVLVPPGARKAATSMPSSTVSPADVDQRRRPARLPVPAQNCELSRTIEEFQAPPPYLGCMITILSTLVSLLSFRVRSRASLELELELIGLRHQIIVLRRQRPRRLRLFLTDRLFWVWLYRVRPQLLDTLVLVKPATMIGWHRKGFRVYW
jgi:hypothetical protein